MPHACITKGPSSTRPAAGAADGATHICRAKNSAKAYCTRPVESIAAARLTNYKPTNFGPPCPKCSGMCHTRFPKMPSHS
jgi:hypothetical protein